MRVEGAAKDVPRGPGDLIVDSMFAQGLAAYRDPQTIRVAIAQQLVSMLFSVTIHHRAQELRQNELQWAPALGLMAAPAAAISRSIADQMNTNPHAREFAQPHRADGKEGDNQTIA